VLPVSARQFWQAQQQRIQLPDPAATQIESDWFSIKNACGDNLLADQRLG